MKHFKGYATQLAFAAFVVAGWVLDVEGARNIVAFAAWALLVPVGVIAVFSEKAQTEFARDPGRPLFERALSRAINWACLVVLVWNGAWWTGIAFGVFMLGAAVAREETKKLRDAAKARAATAN